MDSVPDFFQDETDESLRLQVEWVEQKLGLSDQFFAKLVGAEKAVFSAWRRNLGGLTTEQAQTLREFWRTVLHLLSLQSFDEGRVRTLFEQVAPPQQRDWKSAFAPPWSDSSLKEFLQNYGSTAIDQVDRWVESFKFGDPYASSRQDVCLSTRP